MPARNGEGQESELRYRYHRKTHDADNGQAQNPGGGVQAAQQQVDSLRGCRLLPFLQQEAADSLVDVAKREGKVMSINSAFRGLNQQYLLHRWWKTKQCKFFGVSSPGTSNHEGGRAVDLSNDDADAAAGLFQYFHWKRLEKDPIHFTYNKVKDQRSQGVYAFQLLWNENNQHDPKRLITEFGTVDDQSLWALKHTPCEGW